MCSTSLQSKNRFELENESEGSCPKCPLKMQLIGRTLNNHSLACVDEPSTSLSNNENRSFSSCVYQEIFKKYPPAFYFEIGSNSTILNYL